MAHNNGSLGATPRGGLSTRNPGTQCGGNPKYFKKELKNILSTTVSGRMKPLLGHRISSGNKGPPIAGQEVAAYTAHGYPPTRCVQPSETDMWRIMDDSVILAHANRKDTRTPIRSLEIVEQSLAYTRELERIV